MKAKKGYRRNKTKSPEVKNWFKRYFQKRTCRKFKNFLK